MTTARGSDFLQLRVPPDPPHGVTAWLADALRAAVSSGALAAGERLPATRELAADLGVSRGVVVEAYRRLGDEGVVRARVGAGTVVTGLGAPEPGAAPTTPAATTPVAPAMSPPPAAGSGPHVAVAGVGGSHGAAAGRARSHGAVAGRAGPHGAVAGRAGSHGAAADGAGPHGVRIDAAAWSTGRGALPLPAAFRPAHVDLDLSPGVPDLSAFPRAAWLRAERAVLAEATPADLAYGDPRGNARLRGELSSWLARVRGVRAAPESIVVVSGVAQALALLAQVLVRRGSTGIAVEDPGSRGAREELAHWGMRPVAAAVDADGVVVAELPDVPSALLTPAHQFPTGVVLGPARRRELLDRAATGMLVIEDDYDAEHRYDRAPVPALQASAPHLVAHTGSTSKTLAPGMRLGWLVPPPGLHDDVVAAKWASDLGSPALPQLVLARLMATGEYERHLRAVRARQRRRRDALLAAVREHLPAARVDGVAAGLHLLLTLPDGVDDVAFAARAADAGVLVHPLSWHRTRPGPGGLVLGYAAHPPDRLADAARRLGAVAAAAVAGR